ncbi:MAG: XRE family transcriptional regulator [Eubacterium sp.]|nr:XRE family transcriptional regulator [Eubacterium sp.]
MLHDNIRKYRKEKGFSQEELAVSLHVVRQTVSKWEKGLSVPDASAVIQLAALFEIPVSTLLGIEGAEPAASELSKELADLTKQLADKQQDELLEKQAGKKRQILLFFSFAAMLAALSLKNAFISISLSGVCLLSAVVLLYRNLALFTSITTNDLRLKPLRVMTFLNILAVTAAATVAALNASGVITLSKQAKALSDVLLLSCIIAVAGFLSPRLPFTRHTGLRLPWTVRDADTWNVAHRTLGYISLPLALLYAACALTIPEPETVALIAVLLWLGIPGVFSYVYYIKKMHGK